MGFSAFICQGKLAVSLTEVFYDKFVGRVVKEKRDGTVDNFSGRLAHSQNKMIFSNYPR